LEWRAWRCSGPETAAADAVQIMSAMSFTMMAGKRDMILDAELGQIS
jgi:hypothetical protein